MFRVAIYIWPDGDVQTIIQHNEEKTPDSAYKFFSKIEGDVEIFRKCIHNKVGERKSKPPLPR